ncbi:MAG: TonB-dependent receptor [Gammaproteobacteria bacterium]|nr:TonB-dependent receptor [Gammaproteobacteria bacterium]
MTAKRIGSRVATPPRHWHRATVTGSAILAAMLTGLAANAAERFDLGAIENIEVKGEASQQGDWLGAFDARIGDKDIERFDRRNVSDALNLIPGTSIQNEGGRSERLLFVRGFNSRQVPLYIDGIPVYVPYDGNVDLSRFGTFDIAEIAVTKSLTPMLFGANTLGGSVNLISRRPMDKFEAVATTGVTLDDSFDLASYRASANLATNQGTWYAQIGGSIAEQDHFRLPGSFAPTAIENGKRRENAATNDYKVSFKLGITPNETDEYVVSYYNQMGDKQTPPYAGTNAGVRPRYWRWPEWDKQGVYLQTNTAVARHAYVRLRAFYDTYGNTLRAFDDATYTTQDRNFAFNSVYDDYTYGAGIESGTTAYGQHDLRAAFHYKRDVHREVDDDGIPEERYIDDLFTFALEDTITLGDRLRLIAGLGYSAQRGVEANFYDTNLLVLQSLPESKESAWNIQGGLLYRSANAGEWHLSVARRTRFASIKDRYSFRLGSALPNPDLLPEDAVHVELGVTAARGIFSYGGNLFYSELDDAMENVTIAPTACSRPPCIQMQNIGGQRHLGFELLGTVAFSERGELHANYTFLDRDNTTANNIFLINVPRHKLFTYLRYEPWQQWEIVASAGYESRRYSSTVGDRIAHGFVVGNLKASYRFNDHFVGEVAIDNLGNKLYAYEEGFFEPGRTWNVTLRWTY